MLEENISQEFKLKNMTDQNISQELRLKDIDEKRHYFVEDTDQNEIASEKDKDFCTTLTYTEHFLI